MPQYPASNEDVRSEPRPGVGFVGLGSQGRPMAERIAAAGMPLHVWARREASLESFRGTATIHPDLPSVAERCWAIGVCVGNDDDVIEVVEGMLPGLHAGTVIAIHSTVLPQTCIAVAERLGPLGVVVLDAPVSGGGAAAARGELAVAVGGDTKQFERLLPVLRTFGDPVTHAGGLGDGQRVKLLNNLLFCARNELLRRVTGAGEAMGISREALASMLTHTASSGFAQRLAEDTITVASAAHSHLMLTKDVNHARAVLEAARADLDGDLGPVESLARSLVEWLGERSRA